ncbi:acyl carrier protein (plasmid) [Streptomyces sp. NBC_00536]|uniref:acyl carrier protein n=1 Tax=Streptomyces sp. NBC_00536 TaxID=2975769 RepID=UPI002E813EDC|nr:acyl carrier protein [Streptomyces sp. NBC_00536]WUC84114.1 acyl carrier protein [Streptomyces sp. NBC_00536]
MSAEKTLDTVVSALAHQANVPATSIDPDKPLTAVPGIESVKALRAITDIEDAYDVVIPDDFLFETATVGELAAFVASLIPEGSSV